MDITTFGNILIKLFTSITDTSWSGLSCRVVSCCVALCCMYKIIVYVSVVLFYIPCGISIEGRREMTRGKNKVWGELPSRCVQENCVPSVRHSRNQSDQNRRYSRLLTILIYYFI